MKRRFACTLVFTLLASFVIPLLVLSAEAQDETVGSGYINVFNWGEYIADGSDGSINVNEEFTRRTGIKVNYSNFASNEDMYAKLKSGGVAYDVIIPSDYMIARLIEEGLLQKLDFSNIPNYSYILDEYKNIYFDPNNEYSVPYAVGMVGLIYNTKMVDETPDSWSILWDEKYANKILMFNNPRDAFAIAQFLLGMSVNTTNPEDWDRAAEKLKEQKPLVQSYVMDEIYNKMESGEAALAPYYAGDFLSMQQNNPDLALVYPKEGTNIFVDSMCIPVTAQNKKAAEMYINFLLEPEIALANAEYICYASPHKAVVENPEYSLAGNEVIYPPEEAKANTEYFHNLPKETLEYMTQKWNELKIGGSNNISIYIGLVVVVVVVVAAFVIRTIRKKRQNAYIDGPAGDK